MNARAGSIGEQGSYLWVRFTHILELSTIKLHSRDRKKVGECSNAEGSIEESFVVGFFFVFFFPRGRKSCFY